MKVINIDHQGRGYLMRHLPTDKLYVGYLARSNVNTLLDDGDIDKDEHSQFFMAVCAFMKEHLFM